MGRGPVHLVNHGLKHLKRSGIHVDAVEVEASFPLEMVTAVHVAKALSSKVREARKQGRFPLVLAGNCMSSIGTLAGLGTSPTGIIWLDAHGDFNTPETTLSGFMDGMALATAVGRCWHKLTATVPGFRPVPEANVVLLGARDLDAAERTALDSSAVRLIEPGAIRRLGVREALANPLAELQNKVGQVYLHIDLDVLDVAEARINQFAVTGGLTLQDVLTVVQTVRERLKIAAAAITAYDPDYDADGKALRAGTVLIQELCTE
jgi:arginase